MNPTQIQMNPSLTSVSSSILRPLLVAGDCGGCGYCGGRSGFIGGGGGSCRGGTIGCDGGSSRDGRSDCDGRSDRGRRIGLGVMGDRPAVPYVMVTSGKFIR